MHAKSRPLWQTAVYRSIDGTYVANQIARLRDSRSLRYAKTAYTTYKLRCAWGVMPMEATLTPTAGYSFPAST